MRLVEVREASVVGAARSWLVQSAARYGVPEVLLALAATAYIAAFAGTGLLRAIYPYPIDGIEPGALQEARRVIAGQALYVKPELGYVPFIYGPVYFYLAGLVGAVTGSALLGVRLVSLVASLGSIVLITLLVRRETGKLSMGLVSGGALAACAPLVDMTMDIGRVDAVSLLFVLAATYCAHSATLEARSTWRAATAAGLLVGASLLTKQSGVPVAIALAAVFAISRRDRLLAFALPVLLSLCIVLGLLVLQSGGWPLFYLWELPRRHEIKRELVSRFWADLLTRFALPMAVGPFYLFMRVLARDRQRMLFYASVTVGLVATAWASDSTIGGGRNVELPGYAAFAMLFGLGLNEALNAITSTSARACAIRGYVVWAAVAEFAILLYNPRLVVPYRSDMWDGERLTATLAALPGPIFAGSYQGYVDDSVVAPDLGAIRELEGSFGGSATEQSGDWDGLFAGAIVERRFKYVIVDPDNAGFIVPILATDYGYRDAGPLFPPTDIYWAWRTGWSPKAEVYVPPDQ